MAQFETSLEYTNLPPVFFREVSPETLGDKAYVKLNVKHAEELGLTEGFLQSPEGLDVLTGKTSMGGDAPIAMAYCGHQFGQWAGVLGDGRARLVGDPMSRDGMRREMHLKGAGQTPFSRRGDGLATLGSVIREYVISEAMAALGVPTMRALSIVATDMPVYRNGAEPGAVFCRTARSHIRVGTFQYAATTDNPDDIRILSDFAVRRLYPEAPDAGPDRYTYFLREVSKRQARLVAQWMGFGFIHGVMNTDNMCVSGETIDYGPCAFMDVFHPAKVFSSIDRRGRYAWNKQPEMAHWNLARLAESMLPLLGKDEDAQIKAAETAINVFAPHFKTAFQDILRRKFGITRPDVNIDGFTGKTFKVMTEGGVDFTRFFTALTRFTSGAGEQAILDEFSEPKHAEQWLDDWKELVGFKNGLTGEVLCNMRQSNPVRIPRNHRVEEAIGAANKGDYAPFENLLAATQNPFTENPKYSNFEEAPQDFEVVQQTFCGT